MDYEETYAPIARLEAIRMLLAFASILDFKLYQMDVKSEFLNGFIQEKVYVDQPHGFENSDLLNHVFKLKKAVYGLKQAPKACFAKHRQVVMTGMSVVTSLGHDPDVFYSNLLEGVSGIIKIDTFDCEEFSMRIGGEIKSFSTDSWVARKLSKRMDKYMLYLLTVGKKALADGGITHDKMDELNKEKCGILIGSVGWHIFYDAFRVSYKRINPFTIPLATTNMSSAILAVDLGWMGPNYSIFIARATSNFCILNAANHIIRGEAVSIFLQHLL
ncbi:3-oxoacyl-[acyl-carrier-protein] synthase II, chloroplastic-like [Glycine max]|uniref:3-oxoacyl-[acyl-carrier-protein] synthase II, chloroplastic-like n=1 Tax=Glycine max TaxID=3847 RepID=UPI000E21B810|nr:3-oxoacyl-[acyl-carrier-protein] synthase II, chloroplastic-like [Glycine max]|eukprot:XP_025979679.1 3-oxoacyl-[acyl-carrier-protein] synthase II, chloroplastic-like [Glycine max]